MRSLHQAMESHWSYVPKLAWFSRQRPLQRQQRGSQSSPGSVLLQDHRRAGYSILDPSSWRCNGPLLDLSLRRMPAALPKGRRHRYRGRRCVCALGEPGNDRVA